MTTPPLVPIPGIVPPAGDDGDDDNSRRPPVGASDVEADKARTGAHRDHVPALQEDEPLRDSDGVPVGRADAEADARRAAADPDARGGGADPDAG
jgi:hypothetical protein